ncbi:MAG: replication-relaxation family protein [Pseudomonadota bacterium]
MKTRDRLGRRLFEKRSKSPALTSKLTDREHLWLQFLNLHGMASSLYLHKYTADSHRCMQTSNRMLRKLFDIGLIEKPEQQRAAVDARGNHHVYALSQSGVTYLKDFDLWVDALKPTGPWVHQFMTACTTASIHILCNRSGLKFIPGHQITKTLAVDVPFRWHGRFCKNKLIPDSLFAIRYPSGFIAYVLEADRSTETIDPASQLRKSVRRNIKQYAEFIGKKKYQEAYGLNCPLVVINICVSKTHIKRSLEIVGEEIGACSYLAYGTAPKFRTPFKVPKDLLHNLVDEGMVRNRYEPFFLSKP